MPQKSQTERNLNHSWRARDKFRCKIAMARRLQRIKSMGQPRMNVNETHVTMVVEGLPTEKISYVKRNAHAMRLVLAVIDQMTDADDYTFFTPAHNVKGDEIEIELTVAQGGTWAIERAQEILGAAFKSFKGDE